MKDRNLICMTPVKNEAWILRSFLTVVSTWADYIIISDNGSTDGSKEIAKSFSKVIYVDNDEMKDFDEYQMRKPLIDAARQISGDNVLISLDADEVIFDVHCDEWEKIISQPKGTLVRTKFLNVTPGGENYFEGAFVDFAYIDDGASLQRGGLIHDARLKISYSNIYYSSLNYYHFEFADLKRMESKNRWYQCYERIAYPRKNPLDIYRRYHWMYSPYIKLYPLSDDWRKQFVLLGGQINFPEQDSYQWDEKIYDYFSEYGPKYFEFLDIWSYPWKHTEQLKKSLFSRLYLNYLRKTLKTFYSHPRIIHYTDLFMKGLYRIANFRRDKDLIYHSIFGKR